MKWSGFFGFCFCFCFWHYARNPSILRDCGTITAFLWMWIYLGWEAGYLNKCKKSLALSCYLGLALFFFLLFHLIPPSLSLSASVPPSVLPSLTCFPFLASSSITRLSGTYSTMPNLLRVPENTKLKIKYIKTLWFILLQS